MRETAKTSKNNLRQNVQGFKATELQQGGNSPERKGLVDEKKERFQGVNLALSDEGRLDSSE